MSRLYLAHQPCADPKTPPELKRRWPSRRFSTRAIPSRGCFPKPTRRNGRRFSKLFRVRRRRNRRAAHRASADGTEILRRHQARDYFLRSALSPACPTPEKNRQETDRRHGSRPCGSNAAATDLSCAIRPEGEPGPARRSPNFHSSRTTPRLPDSDGAGSGFRSCTRTAQMSYVLRATRRASIWKSGRSTLAPVPTSAIF